MMGNGYSRKEAELHAIHSAYFAELLPSNESGFATKQDVVKIYGCSDDYVVIEGSCYEKQIDCYEKDVRIYFWDGTVIRVGYCKPDIGVWYIIVENTGTAQQSLQVCQNEDAEIYSDVFEIESEIMSHELVKPEPPNSSIIIEIEEDF